MTEEQLRQLFAPYGNITEVHLLKKNPGSGVWNTTEAASSSSSWPSIGLMLSCWAVLIRVDKAGRVGCCHDWLSGANGMPLWVVPVYHGSAPILYMLMSI